MARISLGYECDEDWEGMEPVAPGVRRCAACHERVVDLSRLTRREAERIVSAEDPPCVSYLRTEDGEVVFRPEPRRVPGLVAIGAASLLAACSREETACEIVPDPALEPPPAEVVAAPIEPASEPVAEIVLEPAPGLTAPPVASAGDRNDVGTPRRRRAAVPASNVPPRHVRTAGLRPRFH